MALGGGDRTYLAPKTAARIEYQRRAGQVQLSNEPAAQASLGGMGDRAPPRTAKLILFGEREEQL